jgi:hypothetical protein
MASSRKRKEAMRLGGLKKRGLSRVRALEMVRARYAKRHRWDLVEVKGV